MVRKKFFISFLKEYEWLESKNRNGYELESRKLNCYNVSKTLVPVEYEYVFLKKGKKSYKEFDYKSRDKDAKAVYANADVLLVKKPLVKGDITVFSGREEKLRNAAEKRTSLNISALIMLGIALILSVLMRILTPLKWVFFAVDVCLVLSAAYNYYLSYQINKYIKEY